MSKQDKYISFDELVEITEEKLRPIVVALKSLILEVDPKACEVVRSGDRAATYGIGPKKMSEGYVYILLHKSWVNLGFFRGAALDDKHSILEGTGKNMRHVKIRSLEDTKKAETKELIQLALEERKKALNLT